MLAFAPSWAGVRTRVSPVTAPVAASTIPAASFVPPKSMQR
jgi:hypothetical protein